VGASTALCHKEEKSNLIFQNPERGAEYKDNTGSCDGIPPRERKRGPHFPGVGLRKKEPKERKGGGGTILQERGVPGFFIHEWGKENYGEGQGDGRKTSMGKGGGGSNNNLKIP